METVAKEYYNIVENASDKLHESDPDFVPIVNEIEAARAKLIIARNGVVGEANAFIRRYGEGIPENDEDRYDKAIDKITQRGELDKLAFAFADSISDYFVDHRYAMRGDMNFGEPGEEAKFFAARGWSVSSRSPTVVTGLAQDLRIALELRDQIPPELRDQDLQYLRSKARVALERLEASWIDIAERFTALKLHCTA